MAPKTSTILEPPYPILLKASAVQQIRADIGRDLGHNISTSASSGEVPPQLEQPMSIQCDRASFMQALQQRASAVAYLLPPSLDVPLLSLTRAPNGLSARLLVLYDTTFEDGKVVVVAGLDKEATVWLHRRLYRSMDKEKIVTQKRQILKRFWLVLCVVFGTVGFVVALVWAEGVEMSIMNLIETNQNTRGMFLDPKATAELVFQPLCNGARVSDVDADLRSEDLASAKLTLTLGILPSGAAVLLLTYLQADQVCTFHHIKPPTLYDSVHSSRFESLSPILFVGIETLAQKLHSLSPKSGIRDRDTSQNNRAFALLPQGGRRGLFENLRMLRQVATRRVACPPIALPITPSSPIHAPFAQYSLCRNIHVKLPKLHVATFAYTIGFDMRPKGKGPAVLEIGWAKSRSGMRDLQTSTDCGKCEEIVFGWNKYHTHKLTKNGLHKSVLEQDNDVVCNAIVEKLFQLPAYKEQDHLILVVYDEPQVCATFLDLGVNLSSGCFDSSSGTRYRWRWLNESNGGLKHFLRDDSYNNSQHPRDHLADTKRYNHRDTSIPRSCRQNDYDVPPHQPQRDQHDESLSSHRRHYSERDMADTKRYNHRDTSIPRSYRHRNDYDVPPHQPQRDHPRSSQQSPHRHHHSEKYRSDWYPQQYRHGDNSRSPQRSNDRHCYSERYRSESGRFRPDSRCLTNSVPPGSKDRLQESSRSQSPHRKLDHINDNCLSIHVVDLKGFFPFYLRPDQDNVQGMVQSLHTHTTLRLSGPSVLSNTYSAGWDAELMLSVFEVIADGPTIDDLLK
ncbi:hypothetical protein DFJ43DRAFT_1151497 [Lentinula guzmanii]|uniref:Uncharacterized protein n=1 Tax=Lentinula guzmanii TaxID=2804957 RepID=A0AA38JNB3_9AGAR|nr:hypothetical protein DFJ43DRAFT_1151497 [Lentinula guzmanii]